MGRVIDYAGRPGGPAWPTPRVGNAVKHLQSATAYPQNLCISGVWDLADLVDILNKLFFNLTWYVQGLQQPTIIYALCITQECLICLFIKTYDENVISDWAGDGRSYLTLTADGKPH